MGPSVAGGDDERLAERMGVPGGAGPGLEGDDGSGYLGGFCGQEGLVDADVAGEPVGWAFGGGLGAVAFDFHGNLLGYADFSEAMSMEKRYFTSCLTRRS